MCGHKIIQGDGVKREWGLYRLTRESLGPAIADLAKEHLCFYMHGDYLALAPGENIARGTQRCDRRGVAAMCSMIALDLLRRRRHRWNGVHRRHVREKGNRYVIKLCDDRRNRADLGH